jgi:hypothetical protein
LRLLVFAASIDDFDREANNDFVQLVVPVLCNALSPGAAAMAGAISPAAFCASSR